MSLQKLLAIAVASVLLIGGVAAVGAVGPAEQADGNASTPDEIPDNTTEVDVPDEVDDEQFDRPRDGRHAEDRPMQAWDDDEADRRGGHGPGGPAHGEERGPALGPSDGMPPQVPDHVSAIHEKIELFQNGSIDHLGHALSALLAEDPGDADEMPTDDAEDVTDDEETEADEQDGAESSAEVDEDGDDAEADDDDAADDESEDADDEETEDSEETDAGADA